MYITLSLLKKWHFLNPICLTKIGMHPFQHLKLFVSAFYIPLNPPQPESQVWSFEDLLDRETSGVN